MVFAAEMAKAHDPVKIIDNQTITAAATGNLVELPRGYSGYVFCLYIHSATLAAGETMDVTIEGNLGGDAWPDIVHFTQLANAQNGTTNQFEFVTVVGTIAFNSLGLDADHDQAAGAKVNLPVRNVRSKIAIANTPSVTLSIFAAGI